MEALKHKKIELIKQGQELFHKLAFSEHIGSVFILMEINNLYKQIKEINKQIGE